MDLRVFRYLVYNVKEDEIALAGEEDKSSQPISDEGVAVEMGVGTSTEDTLAQITEELTPRQPLRNQFNYSERASQSVNNPSRSRATNTDPPPMRSFSSNVSQWSIYDDYMEDVQVREKAVKEKEKTKTSNMKSKDDDKTVLVPDSHEEVYYKNQELRKVMVIAERMANQNSYDEISQDFKYYDDAADDFGDKKSKAF